MSPDTAAREYLDYYFNQPGDPFFAVMLEGPWGSGKTFFIDDYFSARHAAAKAKEKDAKEEEIRITLFGARELADITSQIFAKAHPWLSGKAAKTINFIGSKALSHIGWSTKPEENQKLLQDMMIDLTGRILVFDDFERCTLPVVEVMGFINRFVEQNKLKVVVVASEADIRPTELDEYNLRKEKLVGKTIRVGSDAGSVLDMFAASLTSAAAKTTIANHREAVLTTFNAFGKPNFRSLRSILTDFDRLVGLGDARLRASDDAMRALLLYMIALGLEFRSNAIDADGLKALPGDMMRRLNLTNEGPSPGRQRAERFRERYELVSWGDPIVPSVLLAELFTSGIVDVTALDEHLTTHPKVVGSAHVPNWRAMWSWYDLGESQYEPVRDGLMDQLAKREIVHPGEILHVAGSTLRLLRYGDDILGGIKPRAFFKAYLADLEKADALLPAPFLFGMGSGAHAGLSYPDNDTKAFGALWKLVRTAAAGALARHNQREAVNLLKRLQADLSNGSMLHEWGFDKHNYAGISILHNVPVPDMADLLFKDGVLNGRLIAALETRYDQARNDGSLIEEKRWVLGLLTELRKRLALLKPPFRKYGEDALLGSLARVETWAKPPRKAAVPTAAAAATPSAKPKRARHAPRTTGTDKP